MIHSLCNTVTHYVKGKLIMEFSRLSYYNHKKDKTMFIYTAERQQEKHQFDACHWSF